MSLFDRLPSELIVKIFLCLIEDELSIKSLILSCRRCFFIARDYLVYEPAWIKARPLRIFLHCRLPVDYEALVGRLNEVKGVPINTINFFDMHLGWWDRPPSSLELPQMLNSTATRCFIPESIVESAKSLPSGSTQS